jgi:hypothetical protein
MTIGKVKDFNFSSGGMAKGKAMGAKAPSAPSGMIKSRGTLGVVGNKNPGETRMRTAPNLPGEKMMMNKGGMAMSKGGSKKC